MARQRLYDSRTGLDVATVLTTRLPILALAAWQPTAEGWREVTRMVAEKQTAFGLGMIGAQQALFRAWTSGAWDCARTAAEVAAAAEAPALRTLRGNARRLSRASRRRQR